MALSWLSKKIFGAEKSENLIQNPPWAPKVVDYRLDQEQCRLLILRETSHGHKSLLYDSSSLKECSGPEQAQCSKILKNVQFCEDGALFFLSQRVQSFTSLKADLCQDINGGFVGI